MTQPWTQVPAVVGVAQELLRREGACSPGGGEREEKEREVSTARTQPSPREDLIHQYGPAAVRLSWGGQGKYR